jgi:hypothetical protein
MNQEKKSNSPQVFYNDRWVDRNHFTAFVYKDAEQRLAKSYKEYQDLIATGLWFDNRSLAMETKLEAPQAEILELKKPKARKPSNGANS